MLRFEIDSLDKITERLADWMDKFNGDADDRADALTIFASFVNGCGAKAALRNQFLACKKVWDEKCAIDGLRDVALTREKEMTKGRVRLDLKKEAASNNPLEPVRPAVGGVFQKRQEVIDAPRDETDASEDDE
jgi:hypothetical protein